jgi:hypothetical protein
MKVVDAPARHAAQGREAARVGVEQHLVALAGVGHQPEGPAGAQFHVRHLQPLVDAADDQWLFAPVELEGLAEFEAQRHVGVARRRTALGRAPGADVVRQPAVAAGVARGLQLLQQGLGAAPLLLGPPRIGSQRLLQLLDVGRQFGRHRRTAVLGLLGLAQPQVLANRVPRKARRLGNLPHRLLLAVVHPQDLANHGHGDHSSNPAQLWISRAG